MALGGRFVIGSEGILGIITTVWLRIQVECHAAVWYRLVASWTHPVLCPLPLHQHRSVRGTVQEPQWHFLTLWQAVRQCETFASLE